MTKGACVSMLDTEKKIPTFFTCVSGDPSLGCNPNRCNKTHVAAVDDEKGESSHLAAKSDDSRPLQLAIEISRR